MEFKINKNIIEKFPNIKIGVLIGKNLVNSDIEHLEFEKIKIEKIQEAFEKINNTELSIIPSIKDFRKAYSSCGIKHKKYPCSVESLLKRIKKNQDLPQINLIVDIYNIISISHQLPVGADDLDFVDSYISLELLEEKLEFEKLGSEDKKEIQIGEPCYRDKKEILCEKWNYRECNKSKITKNSSSICFVIEGLENTKKEDIELAVADLKKLLQRFCGGKFEEYYLDGKKSSALIK